MGGGLALVLAGQRGDAVGAVAPFYGGIPWEGTRPDYSAVKGAVMGHYAEDDGWITPAVAAEIEQALREDGNEDVTTYIYPGTDHAFFNDARPEVYNAAASALAWSRTVDFFRSRLS
jgi:carboxymethylenebutenolidase